MYILFCVGLLVYFTFFLPWLLFTYISNGRYNWNLYFRRFMGDKMLVLVCWNLMRFLYFCAGKKIYILEKLLGNILLLKKNAGKTFTENCTKSVLFIKDECTFRFSNFLIFGLCNSLANSSFCIISYLIAPSEVFYQEKL